MTFRVIFSGVEQASHRKVLEAEGETDVGLSFYGLRRKGLPKTKPYLLSERMPESFDIFLDSGGYTANKTAASVADWEEYAAAYEQFVVLNIDRLSLVTEFDCLALGPSWIESERKRFWNELPSEKVVVVWHPNFGLDKLDVMAQQYDHVAIPGTAVEEITSLAGRVNQLASRYGTEFHALSLAKPDELRSIRFSSVTTTSWLSPMKYGETIVWDVTSLKRYPAKMKQQARARHRMLFEREGFDVEKILADDPSEVARLTLWSYRQMEAYVDRRRPTNNPFSVIEGGGGDEVAANSDEGYEEPFAQLADEDADNSALAVRNSSALTQRREPTKRDPSERRVLPVVGIENAVTTTVDDDGNTVVMERPVVRSGGTVRNCDSCYIAANCPAMKPGSECAFDLPVKVETKEQLRGLLTSTLEIQAMRVMFARFVEELNGGYPDPNLSSEIDRLFKLTESMKKLDENNEFAKLTIEARGGAGALSRIFGQGAVERGALTTRGMSEDSTNRILDGKL